MELLTLRGRIVTADAMSCQRKIAQQAIGQGGDYVLALKGNQETLHDDVRRFLDDPATPLTGATDTDKDHGRIETHTAALSTDIAWLQQSHDWPGLAAIGKITASREINGKTTVETRCYLLSRAFTPAPCNRASRRWRRIKVRQTASLQACRPGAARSSRRRNGAQINALLVRRPR